MYVYFKSFGNRAQARVNDWRMPRAAAGELAGAANPRSGSEREPVERDGRGPTPFFT